MGTETPPKIQILQSTTPAITKKALAAAAAAKEQAKMQQEMMKQLMMMFQPGQQPGAQGSGSIGSMMGPMQQANAAGAAQQPARPPTSGQAGPPVDQQPENRTGGNAPIQNQRV